MRLLIHSLVKLFTVAFLADRLVIKIAGIIVRTARCLVFERRFARFLLLL